MKQQNSGNAQLAAVNFQPVNGLDIAAISQEDAQGFIETKREVTSQEYARQNAQVFESLFPKEKQEWFRTVPQRQPEVIYSCKYAPNIMMTLTKGQIEEIARSADVEEIFYYNTQVSAEALEMEEAMAAPQTVAAASNISLAYQTTTGVSNMRIYNHADGTGIKIGQIENSAPDFTKPAFDHMRDNANPENNKFKVVLTAIIREIGITRHAWPRLWLENLTILARLYPMQASILPPIMTGKRAPINIGSSPWSG